MGKRHYTDKERVEALKALEANDYNYNKTSKQLNIAIKTLERWYAKLGEQVLNPNRLEGIVKKAESKLALHREKFIKEVYDVKMKAIQRLKAIIPAEPNVDNVVKALRLLYEITDGKLSEEEGKELHNGRQTFFQLIHQQLITNNETKNISSGRNPEEHTG